MKNITLLSLLLINSLMTVYIQIWHLMNPPKKGTYKHFKVDKLEELIRYRSNSIMRRIYHAKKALIEEKKIKLLIQKNIIDVKLLSVFKEVSTRNFTVCDYLFISFK